MLILLALLPPMPMQPRIVCGLLGTLVVGVLNLIFRRSALRLGQLLMALVISPGVIVVCSYIGLAEGNDRTEYIFWGAIVGLVCVRGSGKTQYLSDFQQRAWIFIGAAIVLGPVMGLVAHLVRCQITGDSLDDEWEIKLSLFDGVIASFAGAILMGLMVFGSRRLAGGVEESSVVVPPPSCDKS
jgi:hypothetical protein